MYSKQSTSDPNVAHAVQIETQSASVGNVLDLSVLLLELIHLIQLIHKGFNFFDPARPKAGADKFFPALSVIVLTIGAHTNLELGAVGIVTFPVITPKIEYLQIVSTH